MVNRRPQSRHSRRRRIAPPSSTARESMTLSSVTPAGRAPHTPRTLPLPSGDLLGARNGRCARLPAAAHRAGTAASCWTSGRTSPEGCTERAMVQSVSPGATTWTRWLTSWTAAKSARKRRGAHVRAARPSSPGQGRGQRAGRRRRLAAANTQLSAACGAEIGMATAVISVLQTCVRIYPTTNECSCQDISEQVFVLSQAWWYRGKQTFGREQKASTEGQYGRRG